VAMKGAILDQQPKVVLEEYQVRCAYDSMPSGQWIPKIFRPKGKHSFHQALTKYLTNDPLFCSESIN
jgi:hypothetical protein